MRMLNTLTLISLLATALYAQANNVDTTGGSSRLFDSINGGAQRKAQFGVGGGSGGAGMPQQTYGNISSSATNNSNSGGTYSNPSGGVGTNNGPNTTTPNFSQNQGGNNAGGDLASILAKVGNNPQIMQLLQAAMASGNKQQLQSMIQLINNFSGSSGGGGAQTQNNGQPGFHQNQQPGSNPNVPPHCAAPKYNTIMSAAKNMNLKFESQLNNKQGGNLGSSQISYVYYNKKEETNYIEYKLVFKYQTGAITRYNYFHFTIARSYTDGVRFSTYFTTSNTNLLTQIINETDFAATNAISCGDLRGVYNGGGGGPRFVSAFSAQPAAPVSGFGGQGQFQQQQQQQQGFGNFRQPQQNFGQQQQNFGQQQQNFGQQQQNFGQQQPGFGGVNQMGAFNPFGGQQGGQFQQQQQPQQSFGAPANSGGGAFLFNQR